MARRIRIRDGYPHTPSMWAAATICHEEFGCTLREWIFRWRDEHPFASVLDLAEHWSIAPKTIYDWLGKLHIGTGGVQLIDLDAERAGTERCST